jgi:processive 1,2-diacylglycerol beta-glucosyltransferase
MDTASSRVLIVTAAFGEGHNSAAKHLALALDSLGHTSRVADPCLLGAPGITALTSRLYRFATTYTPAIWAMIYRSTDRCDFSRRSSPVMRFPERALGDLIDDYRPTALVSTYPLYPYFLKRIRQGVNHRFPVFTVVTDSIEINAAWLRAPTDWWLVTDPLTRAAMAARGLDPSRIIDTGFPVHPSFSRLTPLPADDPCAPFRILYFATAKRNAVKHHGRALLEADPAVHLTIALGKNVRRLYREAASLKADYPGRVRLLGWTRRVPQLLNSHHLVVGKAGGATVHEAIAAQCPMLIHHLVPGQEEGNLRLLESIGGGRLAESPQALREVLGQLLAHRAAAWRTMKQSLASHGRNAGALAAARFIAEHPAPPARNP